VKPAEVLDTYVRAFVDELARSGVHHVCACPGSRSTPLALLLASHPDIRLWMHLDERSAAYFALGLARPGPRRNAAGVVPVAVLSTSGTAAANFFPAILEAQHSRIPLLVLTADRPPELSDVGAPQAMDQIHLYGNHVKWFVAASLPESTPQSLRYIRTLAGRAVGTALASPAGPVHLNFPFREPLIPAPAQETTAVPDGGVHEARRDGRPYVAVTAAPRAADGVVFRHLAERLTAMPRGLIVCGPQHDPALPAAVAHLAARLHYPILADPLSGVRCGPHDHGQVLDAYDAFLRDEHCASDLIPEVIVRLGAMPTSKPVLQYLQRHSNAYLVVVDGGGGWQEPALLAADMIFAEPAQWCLQLAALLDARATEATTVDHSCHWLEQWLRVDRVARATLDERLAALEEPFEGKVFAELAAHIPDGATIFAGNSMPVRDLDAFFAGSRRAIHFLANRGLNGIDGVVSSALGASAVRDGPLILVIGDLSFYHDLNGLLAGRLHDLDAMIILLNNDGGGIFSFLPQAAHREHFELLFGTPHGLSFRGVVEMYGGRYQRVASWPELREALAERGDRGLRVVEIATERQRNVALHRELWAAVSAALAREWAPQGVV
jgi:2-succinyl-5-enolpyruvyl-6-hydroxy-3-cyclohexene-1-carboxylate synthase